MNGIGGCPRNLRAATALAAVVWVLGCVLPGAPCAAEEENTVQEALGATKTMEAMVEQAERAEEAQELLYDDLGRRTPRTAVLGTARAVANADYARAARYFDLSEVPADAREEMGETLAWKWQHILNQVFGPVAMAKIFSSLSSSPEGHLDDGLPRRFERFASIPSRTGEVDILAELVPRADGKPIWLISTQTVAQIPRLWAEYGYYGLEAFLPRFFFHVPRPHGIQPWQWIGLLLLAVLCTLLGWLAARGVRSVLLRFRFDLVRQLGRYAPAPIGLFAALWIFRSGRSYLRLNIASQTYLTAIETLVLIVAFTWIAVRLADALVETLRRHLVHRRAAGFATVILPTVRRVTQILIVVVAGILFLDSLGFNVTALVAGLGVGGLAVALAAQRTIENLIGGITLYADQPVRVGDFCRFNGIVGTVEAIGLRSTRIRTLDRTVMSVPNAEFANLHLDNFAPRDKIWFHPKLCLRYETTPDQLRYVLVEIRRLLYGHPRVDNDGARIRFTGFGDFSLDLDIFAYILATDYAGFLEVAEDLNLRIMDIVVAAGTRFAFPSQTTYLEQGSSPPPDAAKAAGARVHEWREKNELFLPSFPNEVIAALQGSVDYPPAGSPDAARAAS